MLDFQRKRRVRQFIYSPLALFLLVIAIIIVGRGAFGVYKKAAESKERLQASTLELDRLRNREKTLSQNIDALKTDRGIEAEIRERYRVAKEGEEMIILLNDREVPVEEAPPPLPWWKRLFR